MVEEAGSFKHKQAKKKEVAREQSPLCDSFQLPTHAMSLCPRPVVADTKQLVRTIVREITRWMQILAISQIAKSVLLSNADFNRERTNKRNAPNDADFNEARMPEFGQEKQLSFEKSDGGTKSKVGRLISQFQEFAKVSSK